MTQLLNNVPALVCALFFGLPYYGDTQSNTRSFWRFILVSGAVSELISDRFAARVDQIFRSGNARRNAGSGEMVFASIHAGAQQKNLRSKLSSLKITHRN